MASPKTLELRERMAAANPRVEIKSQGPSSTEALKYGKMLSTNRHNRLVIEKRTLTREQRLEYKKLRTQRFRTGEDPPPPKWAVYQHKQVDVADIAAALSTVETEENGRSSSDDNADGAGNEQCAGREHPEASGSADPQASG